MSGTDLDEDEVVHQDGQAQGGTVSDADIRDMLAQEKENSRRLKLELANERTGRNRAEQTATTHQSARYEAEELGVAARIEAAETAAAGLKKDYAAALAEGNYDAAAEVQDKLAELRGKQLRDRDYKTWLDGERRRQAQAPQPAQAEGVDLANYSPRQRQWIRDNPEFMEDPKVRAKTFAGHQLAVADGVEVDSPEYFEIINEVVSRGKRAEPNAAGHEAAPRPRERRDAPLEVPVSRSTPQQSSERRREVKLSPDEMEAADIAIPDIPVQGRKDSSGNWIPGRYERYVIQRQKLRARGQ